MTEVSSTRLYLGNLPRNGMLELPTLDGYSARGRNALDGNLRGSGITLSSVEFGVAD